MATSKSPTASFDAAHRTSTTAWIDPAQERKLIRKLDYAIIPPVMLLYCFSFLDRVNIGNARLYGLEEDLGLEGNQYQIAVSLLFVTYILSELPSNLVLKRFTPSRWISFLATGWGVVATLTGVCQNFAGLVVCRLVLGALEGGLFPGMAIYLTFFYSKRELALRIGFLFVSSAIAGACGGLLAFAIGYMDGIAGQRGWRWIMIIEGIPTMVLGVATWWWLADEPQSAYYLNAEDRELMRVRRESQLGHTTSADEFLWEDVRKGLKDWKMWAFCFSQFGADTMLYGYSTFLPTIIEGINPGASAAVIQVLTIPCYALGAISYLTAAFFSDRQQRRGVYAISFGLISAVGYVVLMSTEDQGGRYAGTFLVAMGLYVLVGLPLAWLPNNCPRYGKRTTATGLQLTIGNTSGIMSSFLYPDGDAPRYIKGHAVTVSMVLWACLVYAIMWWHFSRLNAARAVGKEDFKISGLSEDEINELGDESPRYEYTT